MTLVRTDLKENFVKNSQHTVDGAHLVRVSVFYMAVHKVHGTHLVKVSLFYMPV